MITKQEQCEVQEKTVEFLSKAGIILTDEEKRNIEVADFGLDELKQTGLQLITYINTDRYCAKDLILLPKQTCPEHKHPSIEDDEGKQETFRCRWGKVWLYVEGPSSDKIQASIPKDSEGTYTVFHEIELNPGEQYTIEPNTLHWFQADVDGAVVSEFSSRSRDESDIFTDPRISRIPEVIE
ncbi:D-lyxose/D-mannose family sugar isomerase [Bacillus sp. Marseille-Q3570]|uniref:D-lyxose/D-mannose family sugar isomerase n=1 Tax=Bacillus sp. Marseille-Q3570 TaxID=2963522 RepID=UPI0021B7173D|nr:D-lyxose/D-mannose family sugar isomerase [Bacillus sp. Marseille-Q3570]